MGDLRIFEDIAAINPRTPSAKPGEKVSFVAMAGVSEQGSLDQVDVRNAVPGYTPFVEGDVLVAKITPCLENGKGAHARHLPIPIAQGSTEFHILRARPGTSDRYLYHLTRTDRFRRRAEALMTGSAGQRRVPAEFFRRYEIRVPPLDDQRRIAEILDTIDDTIQATRRTLRKHERVRVGLVAGLLCQSIKVAFVKDHKLHLSCDDEPFRDHQQSGMSDRVSVRLQDVAESMVDGPFGSHLKTEHYVQDAGVRVVRLANLGDGHYLNEDEVFVRGDHARHLSRHNVRSGDVLVASLGDNNHRPGRACLYPDEFAPGIVKADCFRIRPSGSVDHRFLMEMLNSTSVASQIRKLAQGVTRDRINLTQLRWVVVQMPPKRLQQRVAEILGSFDQSADAYNEQLRKLQELRSGLAADLFSGQVRTVVS